MKRTLILFAAFAAFAQTNAGGPPVHDLGERLARWKRVAMPFQGGSLSARERQMVEKLVEASRLLDQAFWRQSDIAGYQLYRTTTNSALKTLLGIMGGRWDLTDDNRVFAGDAPMPTGREVYPHDLSRDEVERYVAQHAGDKSAIYDPYTVVKRQGGRLIGVPYHV